MKTNNLGSTPIRNDAPALIPDFGHQDEVFRPAFEILREAIANHSFPAASVAVTHSGRLIALKALGSLVYDDDGGASLSRTLREGGNLEFQKVLVAPTTMFDLASVTKVVATTTMAMILYQRGLLELDAPIIGTLPEFLLDSAGNTDARRKAVTFRMLLAHSSGLPAYERLFLKAHSRDELLTAAFTMPLSHNPGERAEYSDIGFIILGIALERIAEESLDLFCQREVLGPLAMSNTAFNPPAGVRTTIPPTADERTEMREAGGHAREMPGSQTQPSEGSLKPRSTFRNRVIQGEVQDENAYALGGVAGHAGLFSTAEDIARFAAMMLQCRADALAREPAASGPPTNAARLVSLPILRPETISLFTRRDTTPGSSRALGWDTPSTPSQSGKHFGSSSFGHLGYTGTSLWIDPDRQLSITLLTNRTWPDCSNQAIKTIRPRFHDAVIECLENNRG